ncbi:MAG: hypothetical protein ABIR91_03555 [Candidatus Saccharimonadales bacterium]
MAIPKPVSAESSTDVADKKAAPRWSLISLLEMMIYLALPVVGAFVMGSLALGGKFWPEYVLFIAPIALFAVGAPFIRTRDFIDRRGNERRANGVVAGNVLAVNVLTLVVVTVLLFIGLLVVYLVVKQPNRISALVTGDDLLGIYHNLQRGQWQNHLGTLVMSVFLTLCVGFGFVGLLRTTFWRKSPNVATVKPVIGDKPSHGDKAKHYTVAMPRYRYARFKTRTYGIIDNVIVGMLFSLGFTLAGMIFLFGISMNMVM